MVMRNIVVIDEDKCNGCGECVTACAEGAIEIIDGKAKLVSEIYCDGLGACLGACPEDAITVEQREAVGGCANVGACAAALGCKVVCCGTIGSDAHGVTLRGLLDEIGLDTAGVITLPDRPTTTKTRPTSTATASATSATATPTATACSARPTATTSTRPRSSPRLR